MGNKVYVVPLCSNNCQWIGTHMFVLYVQSKKLEAHQDQINVGESEFVKRRLDCRQDVCLGVVVVPDLHMQGRRSACTAWTSNVDCETPCKGSFLWEHDAPMEGSR